MSIFRIGQLGFLLLLLPFFTKAVLINEIAWMGTGVGGVEKANRWRYEWIELFNDRGKEINLQGWEIENALSNNQSLVIKSAKISPGAYFVICKTELSFCDLIESDLSFQNNYQKNGELILKKGDEIIDQTPKPKESWPFGDNETKRTMERRQDLSWQTSKDIGGTPKKENSVMIQQVKEPDRPMAVEAENHYFFFIIALLIALISAGFVLFLLKRN